MLARSLSILERLSAALDSRDPEGSVRAVLSEWGTASPARERLLNQALLLGERARQRDPRASTTELELSLGVLLVRSGVLSGANAKATE